MQLPDESLAGSHDRVLLLLNTHASSRVNATAHRLQTPHITMRRHCHTNWKVIREGVITYAAVRGRSRMLPLERIRQGMRYAKRGRSHAKANYEIRCQLTWRKVKAGSTREHTLD